MIPHHIRRVLGAVRERLARGWCQHYVAVNAAGQEVTLGSTQAVSWCLVGAVSMEVRAGNRIPYSEFCEVVEFLRSQVGDPVAWNNAPERTQEDVLHFLDGLLA